MGVAKFFYGFLGQKKARTQKYIWLNASIVYWNGIKQQIQQETTVCYRSMDLYCLNNATCNVLVMSNYLLSCAC